MTETFWVKLLEQGGFALLAAVMFFVYRKDAKEWAMKQSETATAFMGFGERTSAALTLVTETQRQQSEVLAQIELHLRENHLCPVTQVTTEMLRAAGAGDAPGRRRIDHILRAMAMQSQNDAANG